MQSRYQVRDIFDTSETKVSEFASVYVYLFAGISLLIAVFLFLPRMAAGG